MAAAAILNFGKMSITLDWIKISCIKLYGKMHNGNAEMTTDQKSKPEVNLRDDIMFQSDYNRYSNQIWYRTQIPHCQHAGMAKFT